MKKNDYNSVPSWRGSLLRSKSGAATAILFFVLALFVSCSETDDEANEFTDWQARNETYFQGLYTTAQQKISSGDTSWKIFAKWSLESAAVTKADDHIVVQVLQEGSGSGCPLYTDSVKIHYRGRLMPSASYSQGYVFDETYSGTFNAATAHPVIMGVGNTRRLSSTGVYTTTPNIDGFTTALMNMHIGDQWRVYVPYALGYGSSSTNASIPAYSTLVFDLQLVAYYRAGTSTTGTRAGTGHWVYQ